MMQEMFSLSLIHLISELRLEFSGYFLSLKPFFYIIIHVIIPTLALSWDHLLVILNWY